MTGKRRIPFYYWPFWMLLLAAGLFVFYVLFTPIWVGIRAAAWLTEDGRFRLARHGSR